MPTVAFLVEKYVRENNVLRFCLEKDIISFHRLAKYLRQPIEKELNKEVSQAALVMALSRIRDKLIVKNSNFQSSPSLKNIEISLRSDIICIDLAKTSTTFKAILEIQRRCAADPADVLSITQSTNEISIIAQAKYFKTISNILKNEKKLNIQTNLSLVILKFGKEILYQPGFFDRVISELAWENINIYQLVSTLRELLIVVSENDSAKAYSTLFRKLKK